MELDLERPENRPLPCFEQEQEDKYSPAVTAWSKYTPKLVVVNFIDASVAAHKLLLGYCLSGLNLIHSRAVLIFLLLPAVRSVGQIFLRRVFCIAPLACLASPCPLGMYI